MLYAKIEVEFIEGRYSRGMELPTIRAIGNYTEYVFFVDKRGLEHEIDNFIENFVLKGGMSFHIDNDGNPYSNRIPPRNVLGIKVFRDVTEEEYKESV